MEAGYGSDWAAAFYASEWIIRLIMMVVVPFRRSPEAAKGWLLFVFFLPWPGLALYLLIGRPRYPAWRLERFARLPDVLRLTGEKFARITTRTDPVLPANMTPAVTLTQNLGHLPAVGGNAVELISDYQGFIDQLVADIDAARHDVHLLFYIFASDATGWQVADALARAVRRGVKCRVLIDALGSRAWSAAVMERLASDGVAAHLMLPVNMLLRKSARADLRNHRKIAVIDGRIGYAGSQNIVDADFKPGIVNQELMVRVQGPVVLELQAVFIADWFIETEEVLDGPELHSPPALAGDTLAQVLPSGPDIPELGIETLIVALIHAARERIVIATPYFVPNEALMQAMRTAVLRGVAVHLVVSKVADQMLVSLAQRSYYSELLACGVRIHLYRDKLLHAKHVAIDDEICVIGSSNVDIRSFVLNAEVSLIIYDRVVALRLRQEQERYFTDSDLLEREVWRARPYAVKVVENFARLLSPLL